MGASGLGIGVDYRIDRSSRDARDGAAGGDRAGRCDLLRRQHRVPQSLSRGETFGTAARAEARVDLNDRVALSGGIVRNLQYGSESSFELVRPVPTMEVRGRRSEALARHPRYPARGRCPGPDRTGPHGLLPPIQRETLAFDRPYEAGCNGGSRARGWNTTCGSSGSG